eukprot:TRINITY_DN16302_c0_g1_i1.p3 TRINITY_DN16302_c0_g1~~TRINITY_DN16302_c0_g1_i1.p3  ORF type:complete len:102 (+),score=13.47 TRINITY_DN16302_c0_g1_i1:447-752(+)
MHLGKTIVKTLPSKRSDCIQRHTKEQEKVIYSTNRAKHLTNNKTLNITKANTSKHTNKYTGNSINGSVKKLSLSKKAGERKVKSQCTANRSPAMFQDITIE